MPPVGFEPTISAGERPLTHALDRAVTGPGYPSVVQINVSFAVRVSLREGLRHYLIIVIL